MEIKHRSSNLKNICSIGEGDLVTHLRACPWEAGIAWRPSRNKGAGRRHFSPWTVNINTWPIVEIRAVPILPNLFAFTKPLPYTSMDPPFPVTFSSMSALWSPSHRKPAQTCQQYLYDPSVLQGLYYSSGSRSHYPSRPVCTLLKHAIPGNKYSTGKEIFCRQADCR